jgi:hypothetical protein
MIATIRKRKKMHKKRLKMIRILTSTEADKLYEVLQDAHDVAADNYEVELMVRLSECIEILEHLKRVDAEEVIK